MATAPQASLPKQCGSWRDLKAAYRLLSNEKVDAQAIQGPHRALTLEQCANQPVVLCVQDDTELEFNHRSKVRGLGKLANGRGQGLMQHSTLAVRPDGQVLGVLDEFWFTRVDVPEDETRRERQERWRESEVWCDAVRNVGPAPEGTRFIQVTDRAGDCLELMQACDEQRSGFVIRARHDRRVQGATAKLWDWMGARPVAGTLTVKVSAQRNARGKIIRPARKACVSIRYGYVQLDPPWNHPTDHPDPRWVWAVYVREDDPPKGTEPVDWMLLTSEPVEDLESAKQIISWYRCRWVIEEWHRVQKEGCQLQASQLDDAADIQRLAAIVGVLSVRLLQLRDLAGFSDDPGEMSVAAPREDRSDDPEALRSAVPWMWCLVVSRLAKVDVDQLTPRQFWLTIAKRGGWIGRQRDGRPGWKVIWRGWYDIDMMVRGADLHAAATNDPPRCG